MIKIVENSQIEALPFPLLIEALKQGFQKEYGTPLRHHHPYPNPAEGTESMLLLMPAWEASKDLGVKIVTVSPNNSKHGLPSIQGIYLLNNAQTGEPRLLMDAKPLTVKRTAAASALASTFLSRKNSKSLLMIGTGALSTSLVKAHASVRPIEKVYIWGRNGDKAKKIAENLKKEAFVTTAVPHITDIISEVDIISCATLSPTPLVLGKYLLSGQHIDLVGAYKPDMREADDELIQKVTLFVDNYEGATKETGDIAIPLKTGVLKKEHIRADLFQLCKKEKQGRTDAKQITCFKSVGHALEDLIAAQLIYQRNF